MNREEAIGLTEDGNFGALLCRDQLREEERRAEEAEATNRRARQRCGEQKPDADDDYEKRLGYLADITKSGL